jgi:[protein-PII] uridylyltransferase
MNPSIDKFKAAVAESRSAIFTNANDHASPLERVRSYASEVDRLFTEIFEAFFGPEKSNFPVTLIALGGYGRAELCPFSDVDLLILLDQKQTAGQIEAAVRFFWDIGLTMGCAVRTVSECAGILGEDIATDISFLESRFVSGDALLYKRLIDDTIEPYFSKKKNQLIGDLRRILQDKLYSPETAIYHVEPDIKNGVCALRDCQRLIWAERLRTGASGMKELHSRSGFSAESVQQFTADYEFLIELRNHLHLVCGRRMDILETALQPEIAIRFGFTTSDAGMLMEMFYKTVRSIRLFLLAYLEKNPSGSGLWTKVRKRIGAIETAPGIRMTEGIFFTNRKDANRLMDPVRILTIFRQALRYRATLSVELRNAIRKAVSALSANDFRSRKVNAIFSEIMSFDGKIGHVMQLMHETGTLSRMIPQFEDLTCKVEYDSYHEFTVDQHLLMTIVAADDLTIERDKTIALIYRERISKGLFRLALLLHDIGKALPGDHAVNGAIIAETVCASLGFGEDDVRRIRTLIYLHLDMAQLSFQRGPDSKPLIHLARRIGDRSNLDMLYVLTALDIRCVGHGTWTAWKAYQLERLYDDLAKVLDAIADGTYSQFDSGEDDNNAYRREVLPEDRERHETWLSELMPGEISLHCDEFNGFERLTVCGWDRTGFLRDIIGCISSEGYNVLGAHIFSMADGKVLDIFDIEPPQYPSLASEKRMQNMLKKWHDITKGVTNADSLVANRILNYPLKKLRSARQFKPQIDIDKVSTSTATILTIKTPDNFGVFHKIVQCLNKNGIDISSAHLSTRGDLANDVFYITDAGSGKISEAKLQKVSRDLEKAFSPTSSVSLSHKK